MDTSLTQFDDFIQRNGMLEHYFYKIKWNNGELSEEDMKLYIKEYFPLAKAVPGLVASIKERAVEKRPDLLEAIEENLQEETEHIELWKRFALSYNISAEELENHTPHPKVQLAVKKLEALAEESFESGVAAMYAMELDLPAIAKTKKEGLCKWYNRPESNEDAHIYFDEHLNEEEHFKVWRSVQIDPTTSEKAVKESLVAQNLLLDGVCDVCEIEMTVDCGC